jgi:hypothetical protein
MDVTKILGGSPLSTTEESVTKIEGAALASTGPRRLSVTKILGAVIIGPPLPETFRFVLRVTDADGCVAEKPCQITVNP